MDPLSCVACPLPGKTRLSGVDPIWRGGVFHEEGSVSVPSVISTPAGEYDPDARVTSRLPMLKEEPEKLPLVDWRVAARALLLHALTVLLGGAETLPNWAVMEGPRSTDLPGPTAVTSEQYCGIVALLIVVGPTLTVTCATLCCPALFVTVAVYATTPSAVGRRTVAVGEVWSRISVVVPATCAQRIWCEPEPFRICTVSGSSCPGAPSTSEAPPIPTLAVFATTAFALLAPAFCLERSALADRFALWARFFSAD